MKNDIHPKYNETTATCACGHVFTIGSTEKEIKTELCSVCHPFYTGKQKLIDTTGSVDKFKKRSAVAAQKKAETKAKKPRKARSVKE